MKTYNPYFVAYCKSQGREPEAQLTHDTTRWPGGKMAGFMLWIREAWTTWSKETNEVKHGSWSTDQTQAFTSWLAARR